MMVVTENEIEIKETLSNKNVQIPIEIQVCFFLYYLQVLKVYPFSSSQIDESWSCRSLDKCRQEKKGKDVMRIQQGRKSGRNNGRRGNGVVIEKSHFYKHYVNFDKKEMFKIHFLHPILKSSWYNKRHVWMFIEGNTIDLTSLYLMILIEMIRWRTGRWTQTLSSRIFSSFLHS